MPSNWQWMRKAECWSGLVLPRQTFPLPFQVGSQTRRHCAYTPSHFTDKILAARPALEGERKQVTVLFADLKDSTELIRGLDPEAAHSSSTRPCTA